jgi:hypothetical protein
MQRDEKKPATRSIEYYRLWAGNGGDSGTWDTDFVEIAADTPDEQIERAVREAAARIDWRDEAPVAVGLYCANDDDDYWIDDEADDDEAPVSSE